MYIYLTHIQKKNIEVDSFLHFLQDDVVVARLICFSEPPAPEFFFSSFCATHRMSFAHGLCFSKSGPRF